MSTAPKTDVRVADAVTREEALRRVAGGESVTDVATSLGVTRQTVNRWRRDPEGRELFDAALNERATAMRSTLAAARAKLEAALEELTDDLLDIAADPDTDVPDRLRAIAMAYDRAGLPRTQRIETPAVPLDLSKLSDEELEIWERINAKVAPR